MESFTKKIIMGIGALAFTLFVLNRLFFFSPGFSEKISQAITSPIVKISGYISDRLNAARERKESYAELQSKCIQYKKAYLGVLTENMQLKATIHYESLSKELRDFQQRYNLSHMIIAKILVKNFTDDEHYFLVNKGLKDGIKKDMTAIYKFQLLGKVTEVFDNYSKILLITDQMCKIAAYTNETSSQGIVRGQNNLDRCSMNYVSHLFKIIDQDLVFSSGQGLVFPEGFCLGKIVFHELKEKSLYHDIELEPLINLQALEYCLLTDKTGLKVAQDVPLTPIPQLIRNNSQQAKPKQPASPQKIKDKPEAPQAITQESLIPSDNSENIAPAPQVDSPSESIDKVACPS